MVDFAALQAAGIANAAERAALIEYLTDLGFTAEQMVDAERRGRLFGLSGDTLQWSGPLTYSPTDAAAALEVPVDDVIGAWRMLGLTLGDLDVPALTQADVDALGTWVAMREQLGVDAASGFLRVVGATLARLADAESAMIRTGQPELWLSHTDDELTTARAWRATAMFIPRIGALIDAVHRHHLVSAGDYFESVLPRPSTSMVCGVGFTDLSGFTALTQTLSPPELSMLLNGFAATSTDVIQSDSGRAVKLIGDSVMWVNATAGQLARTAVDLVDHPKARAAGLQVRAGIAYGELLAINGDYFGNPVNLAARLVAAAAPGQILAAPEVHDQLPDWPMTAGHPLTLKGFDAPITTYEVSRLDTP